VKTSFVIDFVRRATLTELIVAGVVISGPAVASVVPAIEGTKCLKVGSIRSNKRVAYACTASARKKFSARRLTRLQPQQRPRPRRAKLQTAMFARQGQERQSAPTRACRVATE